MIKPGYSSSSCNDQQQLGHETKPQINDCAVGEDAPMQGTDQKIFPTRAQQTGSNIGGNNVRAVGGTDAVNVVGGPLEGPNRKRRGRNEDPPSGVIDCVVCGKHFNLRKALHGHLRIHPERPWRGECPPPTGTGTSRIGPLAQGVMSIMTPEVIGAGGMDGTKGDEPAPSAAKDSTSSPARGQGIDLNQPPEKGPKSPRFDLNMPAPEDDDEEVN
ncbi:hypothetical protein F2P56_034404 [Juglans regia]|uniref:C2H2-type domain-containing protein n=2 Tax=Juglans regia TaxID=51240 RepID=A0A833U760_JUGRE|nr:uncharacterized protein LOC108986675 [Juglans regia]KAF5445350.1 hypothetical protein F2P56_034404 [Juglans regia]